MNTTIKVVKTVGFFGIMVAMGLANYYVSDKFSDKMIDLWKKK